MGTVTKTVSTFTAIEAPVVIATAAQGTLRTLDLTTKYGAWLYCCIGRRVATALTRFGYISIRATNNNTLIVPTPVLDAISSTAVAISTTINGAVTIGDTSITLTSTTSFAVGDTLCIHSDDTAASRVEFVSVLAVASATVLLLERAVRVAHNVADRITTMANVQKIYLPGGDHYDIRCQNNSGQSLVFRVEAVIDNGDTTA